jgi:hypothetical protein
MRPCALFVALLLPGAALAADVLLSQQVRVIDPTGQPLDGDRPVTVGLYGAATGGSALWSESLTATFESGHASFVLGTTTPLPSEVAGAAAYVELVVDGVAQSPRTRLTSVPRAAQADGVAGVSTDDLFGETEIFVRGAALGVDAIYSGTYFDTDRIILANGGFGAGLTDLVVPTGQTVELRPGVWEYRHVTVNGTLTAPNFNGTDGGSILIRARGVVTIGAAGRIDVNGKGYRGGRAEYAQLTSLNQGTAGQPGESYLGWYREGGETSSSNVGGGGGGGLYDSGNYGCAGGGGGYGTAGTTKNCPAATSFQATGGAVYGDAALSVLHLGSGGGGGGGDEDHTGRSGHGGNGGGAIRIEAQAIVNNGTITANGANGTNATVANNGGGGGGSGGSILLRAVAPIATLGTVTATGGAGGTENGGAGISGGGAGGVGRIRIETSLVSGTTTPTASVAIVNSLASAGRDYGQYVSPVQSFTGTGRWAQVDAFAERQPGVDVVVELCTAASEAGLTDPACWRPVAPSGAVDAPVGHGFARVRVTAIDPNDAPSFALRGLRLVVRRD